MMQITHRGYVALIASIIIAFVLMGMVVSMSTSQFFERFSILDSEYKELSFSLADACVDAALLKITQNASYSGGESVPVSSGTTCFIVAVAQPSAGVYVIQAQGVYQNRYTNLRATTSMVGLSPVVTEWEEVANF